MERSREEEEQNGKVHASTKVTAKSVTDESKVQQRETSLWMN